MKFSIYEIKNKDIHYLYSEYIDSEKELLTLLEKRNFILMKEKPAILFNPINQRVLTYTKQRS